MSATPLAKKLSIKTGHRVLILNAPAGYLDSLGPLPGSAQPDTKASGTYDLVQVFVHNKADVDALTATALAALKPGGALWFAYPKKTSAIKTDISRDAGWDAARRAGLVGVSIFAIDDTWSSMRWRPAGEVGARKRA